VKNILGVGKIRTAGEEAVLKKQDVVRAWGRILAGRFPSMSIEITRRCPLSCPGCYAYRDAHLGAAGSLSGLREFAGENLVKGILALVDLHRPLALSIVGGEPLLRRREITQLLPELASRQVHTQIVTSGVAPIPPEWRHASMLSIVVSVDGLPAEHDRRRAPATYDRIIRNISGHAITVHCTITRQMTGRPGYLEEFLRLWSKQPEIRKIWISLYTPQAGETSPEMLPLKIREEVLDELSILAHRFKKLELPPGVLRAYRRPPTNPAQCIFARTSQTISADLKTRVTPCQLGGRPDCGACGCFAAAGFQAVGQHRLPIGIRTGTIFKVSHSLGLRLRRLRGADFRLSLPHPGEHAESGRMEHGIEPADQSA
jgi:MoaA/NifB/PqqE/SkfB family radical SAM enzyme